MTMQLGNVFKDCDCAEGAARATRWQELVARAADVLISGIALVFLLPLGLAVAVAIRTSDPGPVLFGHRRVGLHGREFKCLKFRSMAVDSDARLQVHLATSRTAREEWDRFHKLEADPRITPIGGFLRRSSLDELPQLINVLRGEMSVAGPRPIVRAEIPRYGRRITAYCSVRPGVTGLWQVIGRNRVSYRRRVAMDVLYVRRRNLALNMWIIAATIPAVLLRKGAA